MKNGNYMSKNLEAEISLKVPFFDVDPMGVVWHGNYIKYFELARCALLDQIEYNYNQMKESGYAFPVVKLKVKYICPCFFEQEIKIKATLIEYENCLNIKYIITDAKNRKILTKAQTSQVAINMQTLETCFVLPADFLEKISLLQ